SSFLAPVPPHPLTSTPFPYTTLFRSNAGRFWDIIDKHKVNIFYTAPTAIRSLMAFGTEPFAGKDLSSLKVLGSVGEPINEEAWEDRKSTRLNSSHVKISYAVFCLKKK